MNKPVDLSHWAIVVLEEDCKVLKPRDGKLASLDAFLTDFSDCLKVCGMTVRSTPALQPRSQPAPFVRRCIPAL